jgi:hypothetical protein
MGNTQLSQIQRLYLEALLDGPQETGKLVTMVRDKLTQLKSGNNPVGGTARSQAVLDELEKEGYITVVEKKIFGGKKYALADKGKQALA